MFGFFHTPAQEETWQYVELRKTKIIPPCRIIICETRTCPIRHALTAAFKEYTAKSDRKKERPSVLKKLRRFKEAAADIDTPKVRKKELDAR